MKLFSNITKTNTNILAESMDSRPSAYDERCSRNSVILFGKIIFATIRGMIDFRLVLGFAQF